MLVLQVRLGKNWHIDQAMARSSHGSLTEEIQTICHGKNHGMNDIITSEWKAFLNYHIFITTYQPHSCCTGSSSQVTKSFTSAFSPSRHSFWSDSTSPKVLQVEHCVQRLLVPVKCPRSCGQVINSIQLRGGLIPLFSSPWTASAALSHPKVLSGWCGLNC